MLGIHGLGRVACQISADSKLDPYRRKLLAHASSGADGAGSGSDPPTSTLARILASAPMIPTPRT